MRTSGRLMLNFRVQGLESSGLGRPRGPSSYAEDT